MRSSQSIAAMLVASLLVGAFPGIARADNEGAPNPAASTPIRASVDRAAARLATQPSIDLRNQRAASAGQAAFGGGGGGGKAMMIVTLVTTVVGLGATYYVMKEMKKQTDEAVKQQP